MSDLISFFKTEENTGKAGAPAGNTNARKEVKRTARISMVVTHDCKEKLKKLAEAEGKTLTDYIISHSLSLNNPTGS